jgi:UDP-N-acetylmuramoyl-tripeptide--D-alanyl-D-alanine ligase
MIRVSLSVLADALDAQLIGLNTDIDHVTTNTRQISGACLFVALKGERFDAHDFIQEGQASDATAILVSRPCDVSVPQLVVKDTRIALGKLAAWLKCFLSDQTGLKTVALTGSCGKTTVKEMTAAILSQLGSVLATAGNFNNDIGVPLTLLRLTPEDRFAVIELGANHLDEIDYTTNLVKPDVALINNLAAAHLEGFGSIEGVAKAKGEIFNGLPDNGTAVINLDSCNQAIWVDALRHRPVVTFSRTDVNANFYATDIHLNANGYASFSLHAPQGKVTVTLSVLGEHNVSNALAAAALSSAMGANLSQIANGLSNVTNAKGRVTVSEPRMGLRLIDDTYNASVASVKAAIDLLASFDGQRWLALGDMAELGESSFALHREVAEYAQRAKLDGIVTFGKASEIVSALNHGHHFQDKSELNTWLIAQLNTLSMPITVLAKGARSSRMEEVITALQEQNS